MNLRIFKILLEFLFCGVLISGIAFAEGDGQNNRSNGLNKISGQPIRAYMNINNISTVIKNDGISDINVAETNSGLVYPKGSGKTAVFTSGFVWGAYVPGDPQVRVGGTTYATGIQAGRILPDGTAEDSDLDHVRIYRVRSGVYPGGPPVDLSSEANDEGVSEDQVRAQYDTDWTEWPAIYGAPFFDGNDNGTYDPDPNSGDIPGVPGADQTIWFVGNDLEPGLTTNLYGAQPLGIEMQATFWAYSQTGALGNMFFRKYIIVNRSGAPFNDMYVCFWSDVDLGNSTDDFVTVDTTLSLSMAYNANATDPTYTPLPPPTVGFDFFQGPLVTGVAGQDRNKNGVDDAFDFGIFKGANVGPGLINLPMTAAFYFTRGAADVTDPVLATIEGSNQFYNFMQGKIGLTGEFFVNPITGQQTTFVLTGDVPTREGWIDGLDQGPGDRRQGLASGPFTMAPNDTQEVVVAEILAGATPGVDRISAIGLNKFYDQQAQVAYDNFFDLPTPPPAPAVTYAELDEEIVLDWSKSTANVVATESSSGKGYTFQGYNVYQLPSASAQVNEAVRVATYDVIDGVGKINDFIFDPVTGSVVIVPVQFGNDTGIKRYISIKEDKIKQQPLINGIRYYFAVTAYSYNPDLTAIPNNLENPIAILTLVPQSNDPGVTIGDDSGSEVEVTHTTGTADGGPMVQIVDPTATTGHNYQVTFHSQAQVRNEAGLWVPAGSSTSNNPNDPDTLTGTTITAAAIYGPSGGEVSTELDFTLDVVHHYYGFVDGVILTFPANVQIISSPPFETHGGTIEPVIMGQEIHYGNTSGVPSGYGSFGNFGSGSEHWSVYVAPIGDILPVTVDWYCFDDDYYGAGALDVSGTTTVTTIGTATRTANLWDVTDTDAGNIVLQDRSFVDGIVEWPPTDLFNPLVGLDAAPIVDGFQINLSVGYAAPINFFSIDLTEDPTGETSLTSRSSTSTLDIQNYTIFGGVTDSWSISNFGVGTTVIEDLQQDYEYRFTGVYDEGTDIGGQTVYQVIEGGQMATCFRMVSGGALATNPLNPSPGTAAPFLIRIPFEVWNVDDPDNEYQVNLTYRDRVRDGTENPFWAWNPDNRMYAIIVNSPYDPNQVIQVDGGPDAINAPATWVTVHYGTNYGLGAVVKITYANPIQFGVDTYGFQTTAPAYSSELAASQVNNINVFPNPYYGINSEELNKYNRFVTFSHLPDQATVRIFNLAGVLVQTIQKDEPGQFLRWNLSNEDGLPVASGLYIAYIELPELGETKILKLAIVQEQQILDRF
jgi:hypothetical protein